MTGRLKLAAAEPFALAGPIMRTPAAARAEGPSVTVAAAAATVTRALSRTEVSAEQSCTGQARAGRLRRQGWLLAAAGAAGAEGDIIDSDSEDPETESEDRLTRRIDRIGGATDSEDPGTWSG